MSGSCDTPVTPKRCSDDKLALRLLAELTNSQEWSSLNQQDQAKDKLTLEKRILDQLKDNSRTKPTPIAPVQSTKEIKPINGASLSAASNFRATLTRPSIFHQYHPSPFFNTDANDSDSNEDSEPIPLQNFFNVKSKTQEFNKSPNISSNDSSNSATKIGNGVNSAKSESFASFSSTNHIASKSNLDSVSLSYNSMKKADVSAKSDSVSCTFEAKSASDSLILPSAKKTGLSVRLNTVFDKKPDIKVKSEEIYGPPTVNRSEVVSVPSVKKTEPFVPSVKRNEAFEASVKKIEAFEPSVKRTEAFEPSVRRNEAFEPSVKRNEAFEASVKRNEAFEPSVKRNEGFEPSVKKTYALEPSVKKNEAFEPSVKKIEAFEPSVKKIEAFEPSVKKIEAFEPSVKKIEAFEPSVKKLEALESLEKRTEVLEPPVKQTKTLEPSVKKPEALDPSVKKIEAFEPSVKKIEALEPPVKKIEALDPSVKKPEALDPSVKKTEALEPPVKETKALELLVKESKALELLVKETKALDPPLKKTKALELSVKKTDNFGGKREPFAVLPMKNSDKGNGERKSSTVPASKVINKHQISVNTVNSVKKTQGLNDAGETQVSKVEPQRKGCGAFQVTSNQIFEVNKRTYYVLNILGQGGSGKVYQALEGESCKLVALKEVSLEKDAECCKNEIEILSKLRNSDRVIKMYDFELKEAEKKLLIVLEKGDCDLASILREVMKGKKLSPIQIKYFWSELLSSVEEIHKAGIIHLDLKPANFVQVMGKLKLIDFGIAGAIPDDMTCIVKDTTTGTINYMSPEQLMGTQNHGQFQLRTKSDVWSLGCILYHLINGATPFHHIPQMFPKMQAITNPNYQISFNNVKDPLLLDVLKACLQHNPKNRPTIEQLLAHPYLTGS